MNKKVLKVILILVSMLFLNIEAAHAGLVSKLRVYIRAEFAHEELLLIGAALLCLGTLCYIIFTPVRINDQRLILLNYFSQQQRGSIRHRRAFISRANHILVDRKAH